MMIKGEKTLERINKMNSGKNPLNLVYENNNQHTNPQPNFNKMRILLDLISITKPITI